MKVLVAGGAGFVGSNLVSALVERGDEVLVVDNLLSSERENLPDGAKGDSCMWERCAASSSSVPSVRRRFFFFCSLSLGSTTLMAKGHSALLSSDSTLGRLRADAIVSRPARNTQGRNTYVRDSGDSGDTGYRDAMGF